MRSPLSLFFSRLNSPSSLSCSSSNLFSRPLPSPVAWVAADGCCLSVCPQNMCLLENELESQLGEFHVRMKGKHVPLRPWPAACPPAAR